MILADVIFAKNSLTVWKIFTKCSGLNISIDKTQAKYIGSKLTCDYFPHGLSWTKTLLETLGKVITDNEDKNCILYAKYYIYIKKLSNSNKVDFLNFLTYIKQKINIEKQICPPEGRNEAFASFSLLLDHLWWFRTIYRI